MSLNQASSGRSSGSLMSGREDAARVVGVAPHLRGERRETRKARLIAQLRGEFDLELAPVEVAAEIEYVRFEERLDTPDGRPRAETRDTGERLAGHAPAGRGQDRSGRLAPAREAKVVADHHHPGTELLSQELREGLGGEVAERLAEA